MDTPIGDGISERLKAIPDIFRIASELAWAMEPHNAFMGWPRVQYVNAAARLIEKGLTITEVMKDAT